ncbi:LacI family transcriptional regulator [Georgenia satyanarayanai]|uniref:LacI family DNA-binding transcriptional regulator n=1 Tax=Georgenia satyanarayanai TaxID=860221 RepID=UPI00203BE134|nr:LacI family DNA-binding transcriptional regulator [Georgenia satyanarayanai]MCM3659777.1 LacI family transcriptional regulator [Georgenia satyanarayanai]
MSVSIKDVARVAGVSPTTVSHVVSGRRPVSDETRRKVQKTMAELGYVPMRSARNLALGRTMLIGLLVPDIGNAFFAELTKGVERTAASHGYNVILANTGFDRQSALTHLELVHSRAVDGVVYSAGSPFTDDEIMAAIGDLPLVTVDETVTASAAPLITSDNYNGGVLVARHLLELGHRSALVLHAAPGLESSESRVRGFADEWARGGGAPLQQADGGFTYEGGRDAFHRCLEDDPSRGWTAVFATNDEMALGALRVCHERRIDVPGEIAIAGFDDIPAGRTSGPALTTVSQNVAEMGEIACSYLIKKLNGEALPDSTMPLPVALLVRESTLYAHAPQPSERSDHGDE